MGMTHAELAVRMSASELVEWLAHDELTASEIEFARMEQGMG